MRGAGPGGGGVAGRRVDGIGEANAGQFADDKVFRFVFAFSSAAQRRKFNALPTHYG